MLLFRVWWVAELTQERDPRFWERTRLCGWWQSRKGQTDWNGIHLICISRSASRLPFKELLAVLPVGCSTKSLLARCIGRGHEDVQTCLNISGESLICREILQSDGPIAENDGIISFTPISRLKILRLRPRTDGVGRGVGLHCRRINRALSQKEKVRPRKLEKKLPMSTTICG